MSLRLRYVIRRDQVRFFLLMDSCRKFVWLHFIVLQPLSACHTTGFILFVRLYCADYLQLWTILSGVVRKQAVICRARWTGISGSLD